MRSAILAIIVLSLVVTFGCQNAAPDPAVAQPIGSNSVGRDATGREQASASAIQSHGPHFTDVANNLGLRVTQFRDPVPNRFLLPEVMGSGLGWIDYDLDGWHDIYIGNGSELRDPPVVDLVHHNWLFRNFHGSSFRDCSLSAHVADTGYAQGIAVGDFDADGWPDLFVANYGDDVLFHNLGDGTFEPASLGALPQSKGWSSSAAWLDINADGLLDLYVVRYLTLDFSNTRVCTYGGKPGYCGPGDYDATPDRVMVNQGDGTFRDLTLDLGFTADNGKGLAIVAVDLNDDLAAEIYVANDMAPNFLFTRDHHISAIKYADVAPQTGCAVSDEGEFEASMGISCADYDKDGLPDLYLTHYFNAKNTLYHNLGNLLFVDDSRRSRAAATSFESLGFGSIPADFDGDGDVDLFIANGHVLGSMQSPNEMTPQFLANDGTGRFTDVSDTCGDYFTRKVLGRSAAVVDFDNDGDADISVGHLDQPVALLRNDTGGGKHYLGLQLVNADRSSLVGGRIVIHAGAIKQTIPITSGGSYLASHDPRFAIPCGDFAGVCDVEVHWPSGKREQLLLRVDRYWQVLTNGERTVCRELTR